MIVVRLWLPLIAALLLGSTEGGGACLAGASGKCISFDALPQISQQVAGNDHLAPGARKAAVSGADKPYTGLTIGIAPNLRRAPTVGYKWSFD
jgi:hypothetical protein